jgi:ATP-dependent DNA helicase RecQ
MLYGIQDAAMQRNFIEDSTAPDIQKRIEHQKLNALLGLCEAASCRRKIILEYFGDTASPCGHCDTCDTPPETFDGSIAALKALSCVYRTGQRFGVSYLIDVLLGKKDERMQRFGHDKIPTFGVGAEYNKTDWQGIFRQLVALNLLNVDNAEHGGLKLTEQGQGFLKEKRLLRLRKLAGKIAKALKPTRTTAPTSFDGAEQQQLFDALKAKRLELAKAQNIPPYVIFHDKTLRELVLARPMSVADMSGISGVGEKKMERYGEMFLDVIAQHEAA